MEGDGVVAGNKKWLQTRIQDMVWLRWRPGFLCVLFCILFTVLIIEYPCPAALEKHEPHVAHTKNKLLQTLCKYAQAVFLLSDIKSVYKHQLRLPKLFLFANVLNNEKYFYEIKKYFYKIMRNYFYAPYGFPPQASHNSF